MALKYLLQLLCFVWLIAPLLAATSPLAQPGCKDTCGNNVTIPYPFGIGSTDCFIDKWFEIVCHDNKPYLSKYYGKELGGEVLDVSLYPQTITIDTINSNISVCDNKGIWLAMNFSGSPFMYSQYTTLTFIGCGNISLFADQTNLIDRCTSTCDPNRTIAGCSGTDCCTSTCDRYEETSGCLGINCCQIAIPHSIEHTRSLYLNTNLASRNDSCASVTFGNNGVWLRWRILPSMNLSSKHNPNCNTYNFNEGVEEYRCHCSNCREGNPYTVIGCQDLSNKLGCNVPSRTRSILPVIAVGTTSFGILFLGTAIFVLYKSIRKSREKILKKKFFKKNGGILLQQQLLVDDNIINKVKFFTSIELDKATDSFNENRVLGQGGQGTVYKGMLADGKIVAVKKSKLDDQNQVKQFINEVVILSQINHRNVVKLLGCCLETEVPLLVYEFIPNGTLYDLIHKEENEVRISWDMRLRIAIEVAGALAYLHSAASTPIYHRDVKSSNILLDEGHIAKISDFGISRHVTIEQTHLTTMVKGTFGYLDPEYFYSNQFTDKSDVYSYGVVLVELLTRRKPISSSCNTQETHLNLAKQFIISMEEDCLNMILDTQILETDEEVQVTAVALLAQRCLSLDGRNRPTMKEVAMELLSIKISCMSTSVIQETYIKGGTSGVESDDGTDSSWTTLALDEVSLLSHTF